MMTSKRLVWVDRITIVMILRNCRWQSEKEQVFMMMAEAVKTAWYEEN